MKYISLWLCWFQRKTLINDLTCCQPYRWLLHCRDLKVMECLFSILCSMGQALRVDQHVDYLVCSCFYKMRNTAKLSPILARAQLEIIVFISSHLDYFTCLS